MGEARSSDNRTPAECEPLPLGRRGGGSGWLPGPAAAPFSGATRAPDHEQTGAGGDKHRRAEDSLSDPPPAGHIDAHHFVDFGYWRAPMGRRQLLTWYPTGHLRMGDLLLAWIPDEDIVRRLLDGWADHAGLLGDTGWLAGRLEEYR